MSTVASSLPLGSASPISTRVTGDTVVAVNADIAAALSLVKYMPAAMQGAMRSLVYDVLSNHRLRVIKRSAANFPSKGQAQKYVASRLYRYTKLDEQNGSIASITGEGFGADVGEDPGNVLANLEQGASITTGESMAIPITVAGVSRAAAKKRLMEAIENRSASLVDRVVQVIPRPGRWPLLAIVRADRVIPVAVLVKRREQAPRLRYYPAWDETIAKRAKDFDAAVDAAATVAGQERFVEKQMKSRDVGFTQKEAYKLALEADPKNNAKARRIAAAAAKRVRSGVSSDVTLADVRASLTGGDA
jgi:hypothetical protein